MSKFKIKAEYKPAGDQPNAIKELVAGLEKGLKKQTLFGVTGSGKTFAPSNMLVKYCVKFDSLPRHEYMPWFSSPTASTFP